MPSRILIALTFGGMAAATNVQIFGLLLSTISDDLGYGVSLVGGMRALSAVVAMIGAVALTRVADHVPRKQLMLVGFGLMVVSSLLAATATSVAWFAGYFLVAGASDVILFSTLLAASSDYVEGRALDRANGVVIGSFGLPGFAVVPLAGLLSDAYGWRTAYLLSAGIALTAIVLVMALLPRAAPTGGHIESTLAHIRLLAARSGLRAILLGNYLRFTLYVGLLVYTAAFLIERFDLSDSQAGLYFGAGSTCFLASAMTSGYTLNRLGLRRVLLNGGLLLVAALSLALLPGIPGLVTGALLVGSVALLAVQENGSLGLILRGAREVRGAAVSLNELGAALGGITGAGLGGVAIRIADYPGLGFFLGITALLAYLFTRRALEAESARDDRRETPASQVHYP